MKTIITHYPSYESTLCVKCSQTAWLALLSQGLSIGCVFARQTRPASENRGMLSAYYYPGLRNGSMPSEETAALQTNVKQGEKKPLRNKGNASLTLCYGRKATFRYSRHVTILMPNVFQEVVPLRPAAYLVYVLRHVTGSIKWLLLASTFVNNIVSTMQLHVASW